MAETNSESEKASIKITVEFTGGLEMLFNDIQRHKVSISAKNKSGEATRVKELIPWLCENLMKDPRRELFVQNGAIRSGILVLINDADWELEGEDQYELREGDTILFVSTLHGG